MVPIVVVGLTELVIVASIIGTVVVKALDVKASEVLRPRNVVGDTETSSLRPVVAGTKVLVA